MPQVVFALAAAVGVIVLSWTLAEYFDDENDDIEDVAEGVVERGKATTSDAGKLTKKGGVVAAGFGVTFLAQAFQVLGMFNELLLGLPVVVGHIGVSILGALGVSGLLSPTEFGVGVVSITAIALILRVTNEPEAA